MLVSREWLSQYVDLPEDIGPVMERLTMSGLNHESTRPVGNDLCIDLEVTSNRPDCLGHIGIAREISVLLEQPLRIPEARPVANGNNLGDTFRISISAPELCHRFTARLVRGVKVGPSPAWLVRRLATVGIESVNNVVDVSNYVMLECGQPLHAFDFDRLSGNEIVVRQPAPEETLVAINHETLPLKPGMCVVADNKRAVGLGGVMGGVDSEVSSATKNVLVEAAWFAPRCIRSTARILNLHSAASFRFERKIDPHQIDWASRRCCELILEVAGGELARDVVEAGSLPVKPPPVVLRWNRIGEVLGTSVPKMRSRSILKALGFNAFVDEGEVCHTEVPSWRQDVYREIDLVEEVGRIIGYENVPDNSIVPLAASSRSHRERMISRIRNCLAGMGLDEAMTASLVPEKWSEAFSPWTGEPPLRSSQPMLGVLEKASQNLGAVNLLRRSLVPSLLEVFRINDHKQNRNIDLFEVARVYLPRPAGLPDERLMAGIVCEFGFAQLKGMVEQLVAAMDPSLVVEALPCDEAILDISRSARLETGGQLLGWIGEVSGSGKEIFSLRREACVAELDLDSLIALAVPVTLHREQSPYPAVSRDLNLIVPEEITWGALSSSIRSAAGDYLESVEYRETFRDPSRDGPGRKRILFSISLRSMEGTLTREQADDACQSVIERCKANHGAVLCG